jgi:CheY-like chemotaxis protein
MRILVVDDEKDVREVLRDFLEIEGFEVFEAAEGKSALEIARKHSFDVVLTDLSMPGPDGFGVLKEIRRIRPEAAVLIFTGYVSPANALEALELGCDGYVTKPIALRQLKQVIAEGMTKRKRELQQLGFEYY